MSHRVFNGTRMVTRPMTGRGMISKAQAEAAFVQPAAPVAHPAPKPVDKTEVRKRIAADLIKSL